MCRAARAALASASLGAGCAVGRATPVTSTDPVSTPTADEALQTDFWGCMRSHIAGLAPPQSLVKCMGATVAGSMFALCGLIIEGRRGKRERLALREELGKTIPKRPPSGAKDVEPVAEAAPPGASARGSRAPQAGPDSIRGQVATPSSSPNGLGTSTSSRASLSSDGRALSRAEKVERQVKSILNKLARERFATLYAQLLACCSHPEARSEIIGIIAREVFAKATVQHSYIELYAEVCAKLHADLKGRVEADFKRALLDQCQRSFTLYLDPPRIDECLDYEEKYEELVRYKTKMLGNVKLIGHLLRLRMLSPKVIFHCTEELLSIGSSEALETLCAFLETLGATFDTPEWPGRPRLDEVFARAETLAEDRSRPARIRCLLRDLLDKRKSCWRQGATRVSGVGEVSRDSGSGCESARQPRSRGGVAGLACGAGGGSEACHLGGRPAGVPGREGRRR